MESKTVIEEAFTLPIEDGMARILLKLQNIESEVENSAPDFISVEEDEVRLQVQPSQEVNISIPKLDQTFPVEFKRNLPKGKGAMFKLVQESIWFDIEIDLVKDI